MNESIDIKAIEQLIVDRLTGQITPANELTLDALINQNQEVHRLWQEMQQVYAMRHAARFEQALDTEAAWQKLVQKTHLPVTAAPLAARVVRTRWWRYSAAAVLAGALLVTAFYFYTTHSTAADKSVHLRLANGTDWPLPADGKINSRLLAGKGVDLNSWNTLSVPAGKVYKLQLNDGTDVWLNAASDLKFPLQFSSNKRTVHLNGEGFFKVTHNAAQPFVVEVQHMKVTVLGTEFNISSYTGEAGSVALIKGSVAVESNTGTPVILQPGQMAMIRAGKDQQPVVSKFDETMVTSWMKGMYYFNDERLSDIITIAERWFDIKVEVASNELTNMRFTGALDKNKSIDVFFDMLSKTGNFNYKIHSSGKVTLQKG